MIESPLANVPNAPPVRASGARSVESLLNGAAPSSADPTARPFRTGLEPLDDALGGGLRRHHLTLLAGTPGVGKTIAALQWARTMALHGATALFACYEHTDRELLGRLLMMEIGDATAHEAAALWAEPGELRAVVDRVTEGAHLPDLAAQLPAVQGVLERMSHYSARLHLFQASGGRTGLAELEGLVMENSGGPTVLFVDYLQKVAVRPEPTDEAEKVLRIAEGLKELALTQDVAVVAVVAADRAGLEARRLRLHHLRGSSALAYESDVVIVLNDKFRALSKVHLAYDAVRAETFKHHVVFTLEKNRGGPAHVDIEFRKDFAHYRFDPSGGYVAERLVDERLFEE